MQVKPLLLCGGSGTRLWPISRQLFPKQLLPLGSAETLLQATALRAKGDHFSRPIVLTAEDHRFLVKEQLDQVGAAPEAIILEPVRRNTAPAIGLAAVREAKVKSDQLLLAMPSDQVIGDITKFHEAVFTAANAARDGRLVTFGIEPTRVETGYGYIEAGENILTSPGVRDVIRFCEKPDLQTAGSFVSSGRHFWNGGIFLFRAGMLVEELRQHAPEILDACEKAIASSLTDGVFVRPSREHFEAAPSVSIDYAVMEKTRSAAMVPARMEWSDLGSWEALWELSAKDEFGNVLSENVVAIESSGCLVRSDSDATIATVGVENLVVVATRDAILIVPRSRSQEASKAVDGLRDFGIDKHVTHTRVYRPWGSYEVMDKGDRFQTKRIIVKPGAALSLQMHHHRSEHWVVVSGTARVTIEGDVRLLQESESTFVPAGSTHRLENPGKAPLHLIEVQCGCYLGEDDIVRLDDNYGRVVKSSS